MNNSENEKSIFLPVFFSLLAGFAAGAIVGVLYAPKAGKEIRKDFVEKKDELIEKSKKNYEVFSDKAQDLLDKSKYKFSELKGKGEELIEKGKVKVEEAKDIIVEKVKKGKKEAQEISDYLQN
jgi:gas vesicle protein